MDIKAQIKFANTSNRKVKRVIDLVRGKGQDESINAVRFTPFSASKLVFSVLNSALANAKHSNLNPAKLYIKEIYATQGPTTKRFRAGSRGTAKPVRHKTSHLTVTVTERGGA